MKPRGPVWLFALALGCGARTLASDDEAETTGTETQDGDGHVEGWALSVVDLDEDGCDDLALVRHIAVEEGYRRDLLMRYCPGGE